MDHYVDASMPTGLGGLVYEMAPGRHSVPSGWTSTCVRVECLIGDRPSRHNQVYLSAERGAFDLPIPVLRYETDPVDRARLSALVERCRALFSAMGISEFIEEPSLFELGSGHLHGTCRAGADPRDSVLDPWCRVHDVDNVWVVDGSFMPYPGGLNPTLTIQANASRVARHLVDGAGAS